MANGSQQNSNNSTQNNNNSNEITNSIMKGNGKIDIVGKVNPNNTTGLKNLNEGYTSTELSTKNTRRELFTKNQASNNTSDD